MLDLMFAAALSGMRAAEASNDGQSEAVHAPIRQTVAAEERMKSDREWLPPSFTFEEEGDCPIFFERELAGFGTLRIGSLCNSGPEQ
jgi:hypothetical protein